MNLAQPPRSRFLWTARRAYLARVAAAGALTLVPMACGNSDASTFQGASGSASSVSKAATASSMVVTTAPPLPVPTTAAAKPATTVAPATTAAPTTTAPATFPAGREMVVGFTFAASGGARNPYVAVWVEDASGNLVKTVSLWFEQTGKGTRYLNDLRSWANASGGRIDSTTSGSTRSAGSYTVAWNGTGADGALVPAGQYTLFVEAAREHGPYEITSTPITIGKGGFTVALPNNGELNSLSATLAV